MRFFRKSVLALSFLMFFVLAAWTIFAFAVRDKYVVPILMYHKIAKPNSPAELNLVSPRSFERQMAFLKENGYQVISLDVLIDGMKRARLFKGNVVVITFDDGYDDNYTSALPILVKYDFSATVFMISDFVGTPGFVTWDQLKLMDQAGIKIGSHTRHHVYLPDVTDEATLEDEIVNSKKILEKNLGRPVDDFSYPSGGFSEHIVSVVKKAGYKGACATNRGYDRFNLDYYQLNRIRVNDDDSNLVLWAKVSGYYNLFRKSKNPY
jgi:peptidoglycan/xylan/chitin deacetylase (PgdA/CDA1 family)